MACAITVGPEGAAAPSGLPQGITAERAYNDNILHGSGTPNSKIAGSNQAANGLEPDRQRV